MEIWIAAGGLVITIIGTAWKLSGSLNKQFDEARELVYRKFDELNKTLSDRIDYHEKHDDERFQNVRNDIWDIRVLNAARDAIPLAKLKEHNSI